ncbi:Alpha/Beta hydrolase protein [Mycena rosella]|uniref:Carboxylic ester hydrolase n=1 Tax=Mycena rosella TaxID=1033263 RepID=A0AAD7GSU7_MYCRO|nr:Alpha/Beta hydrolase protein [Mycena rosella]
MTLASLKTLHTSLFFLVALRAVHSAHASTPIVDLGYAQYQGVFDAALNITSFLGIRYAAAPTGNLRWRVPSPPFTVSGVQLVDTNPPPCYQGLLGGAPTNPLTARDNAQSEDCLFLSVYSPAINSTKLLPTIVWIHGGGYVLGSAGDYNGAELVQESNNEVVVVVIQYRLGLFGFLAGEQVQDGGVLNAGLLDQDFALRWVNKNIRKFGGDPEKVTIWGESAGAGSVIQHVVAHGGKTEPQLFRAAITSSTFLPSQYVYNDKIPQTLFDDVAAQAGCTAADSDALECLRGVDAAALLEINLNLTLAGFQGTVTFVPVIDKSFITQSPTELLAQGSVNGDILLSMTNTNEGVIFVNQSVEYDVVQYVGQLFPLFGTEESAAVASIYESLGSPLDQVNAIMKESIFVCPTYRLLDAFPNASYKGEYAVPPALHGDDVFYYFPSVVFAGSMLQFNNTIFRTAFDQGFFSFAAHLDPNAKLLPTITPAWPKWSESATQEMVFNRSEAGAPLVEGALTDEALLDRCEFWKSVHSLTGQ